MTLTNFKPRFPSHIESRADTFPLMAPGVRPWPVTPPPSREEVGKNVYAKRKAEYHGNLCEDNFRMEYNFNKQEAFQGLVVLEVGLWRLSHGFAASLLAELGVETIKIEPQGGDPLRKLTPFGREKYMLAVGRLRESSCRCRSTLESSQANEKHRRLLESVGGRVNEGGQKPCCASGPDI